jgi:hypothetical protein
MTETSDANGTYGTDPRSGAAPDDPLADPDYRVAVVDLLGALAYGELTAFHRLADDARLAPTIHDKGALGAMAVAEFGHYQRLNARLIELGADPEEAMRPFVAALDGFHDQTKPADWFESLVKAYVGDGIGSDFYRAMADYVDADTRRLVVEVLADTGHAGFAVDHVRAAIAADPKLGGRLALWGRRLLGEALAQAQRVAAERDTLTPLFTGGPDRPGADLVQLARIFNQLTEAHTRRMSALGLSA